MKHDITTSEDIKLLLDSFYEKVLVDDIIGYIFTEVAQIDLPTHMPRLYAFWEMALLSKGGYDGNMMTPHIQLHKKEPLRDAHFDQWKKLFYETIDTHFEGPIAQMAKDKAHAMSYLLRMKTTASDKPGFIQ